LPWLVVVLGALSVSSVPAHAQEPLFTFVQISDSQPNDSSDQQLFEQVLAAIVDAGTAGAVIPRPVEFVVFAGDVVFAPDDQAGWESATATLDAYLTANAIPYRAVPGNRDQEDFGVTLYEQFIADSGVWDMGSADFIGHNPTAVSTGWDGLRFIGFNNSNNGRNVISSGDLAEIDALVTSAVANDENVFLLGHHPHDGNSRMPLATILETNGIIGTQRGHSGGDPFVQQGLAGISNPNIWEFNSNAIVISGAILYYEVFPTELKVHVLELLPAPNTLPPPVTVPLLFPLTPSSAPGIPIAGFTATPNSGSAPLDVDFTDLSAGVPTSWHWDFGDGATSTLQYPSHRYDAPGLYDVTLTATNASGSDSLTRVQLIDVTTPLPEETFLAVADARVKSSSPNSNYGSSDFLRLRDGGAPAETTYESYLRFDLSALAGQAVSSATLRLFATDGSPDPGSVYAVTGSWSEASLTWSNAPGLSGLPLASSGAALNNTWVEFDVSSLVTGAGIYDLGLTNDSSNSVYFSSREGLDPPQLVVETADPGPPVADFRGTPAQGAAPLTVAFEDLSTGAPTSWLWEFGDGTTSSAQDPTHTYLASGSYDVRLTATNGLGSDSNLKLSYVATSAPVPPVADFAASPTSGSAPHTVAFTDLSTGAPSSWLWNFGDGATSSAQHPSHTYNAPGVYTVTLTATNTVSSDSLAQDDLITVDPPPSTDTYLPVADSRVKSTSPSSNYGSSDYIRVREGTYESYLRFDLSALGTIPVTTAMLRLYVTDPSRDGGTVYEVGGGWTESGITYSNAPGIGGTPVASAGSVSTGTWVEFDVSSVVTGGGVYDLGMASSSTNSAYYSSREGANPPELVVELGDPGPPVADFDASTTEGSVPLTVTFADRSTGAPTAWLWEFGDGAMSTAQNPVHVYTAQGTYSVRLTVTNAEGSDDELKTGYVVVTAPVPPQSDFSASPTAGSAPLDVSFTDLSTGSPTGWLWEFGDGTTSTAQHPDHLYVAPGTYSVTLTTSNLAGSNASMQVDLIQVVVAPSVTTFLPSGDAKVRSTRSDRNYGSADDLRLRDGAHVWESFLRFDVSGLPAAVISAKLRLYVTDGSADGGTLFATNSGWSEATITYSTRPPLVEPPIGNLGPVSNGTWVEIDVTSQVSGNGAFAFGLSSTSSNSAFFSSREGANPPELVIETAN
jgi:PKD repeat protein